MALHRRLKPFLLAVIAMATTIWSPMAHADFELIEVEPRIDREIWMEFLSRLEPDDDSRMIADLLYSDYTDAMQAIVDRVDAAQRAAGRADLDRALAGDLPLGREEIRELRAAVRDVERGVFAEAEQLAETLLLSVGEVLAADPGLVAHASRDVRRRMHLSCRRMREHDSSYASDGVDLLQLVVEASELTESAPTTAMGTILEEYAGALDAQLRASARNWWEARHDAAVAKIREDDSGQREAERRMAGYWHDHWRMTNRFVERLAVSAGGEFGSALRDQFIGAAFPWLVRATRPEQYGAWIQSRIDDTRVRQQAMDVLATYRSDRVDVVAEAIDLIVQARADHGAILDSRMSPLAISDGSLRDLYQRLLQNSGRRAKLEVEAADSMAALLSDNERKQMRADIAALAFGRRR